MIEFTSRQLEILDILKEHEPITAEQIAEILGVSKATIRSDLAVLVMTNYIDAKPKVGYFLGTTVKNDSILSNRLKEIKVKDVQSVPVVVRETTTVHDAVITLFLENTGSLIVVDAEGKLEGVVSRKDLLKVTLGNANASTMPVNLVMTRRPNVVTITQEESVIVAAKKMIHNEVDSLPVVSASTEEEQSKPLVIGRITKTNMTRLLLESVTEA